MKSGLEMREYGRRDPLYWPRNTYQQKFTLTSPKWVGRSVGIVRSRTKATEFVCFLQDLFPVGVWRYNCNRAAFGSQVLFFPHVKYFVIFISAWKETFMTGF
jgi:hypothetical protein